MESYTDSKLQQIASLNLFSFKNVNLKNEKKKREILCLFVNTMFFSSFITYILKIDEYNICNDLTYDTY